MEAQELQDAIDHHKAEIFHHRQVAMRGLEVGSFQSAERHLAEAGHHASIFLALSYIQHGKE